jgi:polyhydroxybutyrate depolymerase
MRRPTQTLVLFVGLTLAGCGAQGSPAASAPATSPSAVAASPTPGGSRVADLVVGGDRPVTVHVPTSYDPSRAAPLLILLHGYGSSGEEQDEYMQLGPAVAAHGVLYAHPDGTKDSDGNRFWSATDACCDFGRTGVNDVAYLTGVISEIQSKLNVDPKRIDVLGHSNGGFMAYRMACADANQVAAIVSLAGASFANPADCAPSAPVSIAHIHGTRDDTVKFAGGTLDVGAQPMSSYPGAEASTKAWATYDGCTGDPSELPDKVDIDAALTAGSSPAETSITEWAGCKSGAIVQLWTIPNGDHVPSIPATFADTALSFLLDHPKP